MKARNVKLNANEVISYEAKIPVSRVEFIRTAADLATGITTYGVDAWEDLPLGYAATLIQFAQSTEYKEVCVGEITVGKIAAAFLQFRLNYVNRLNR